MLGAIIGDIVGSRYEFSPTNDYNFEMFGAGSDFTDDTVCTVAVAEAILRGRDYGESLHLWCRRYPHPKGGYGGRFGAWVHSDAPQPYGSFGNGSAMRVSPVGWWYADGCLEEQAAKSAACSHNHPEGIKGAVAVAMAVADCRTLRRLKGGDPVSRHDVMTYGLGRAIGCYVPDPKDFILDIEDFRNIFDETCQGTVPVALAIILESVGFEDALRRAVSLGADADTLGAIVGSIAEALWGIPEWIKVKALSFLPTEMKAVLMEFRRRL